MTPQSIITLARDPLNDTDGAAYRQSDAELLRAVNAGIKEVAIILPGLFSTVGDMTCVAGAEQAVTFTDVQTLQNVLCIHGGNALTQFDRASLDAFKPAWRTDTPAAAQQWSPIEGDPLRFLVYPPAVLGQVLDVQFVRIPTEYALTDTITELPATLESALAKYVVYWAESKDDEHVNSGRAVANYQSFVALIKPAGA